MKYRAAPNWGNISDNAGIHFFTQLLEELLFDYSLDTNKPSATNSYTLLIEAIETIALIDAEIIDPANLQHIIEEALHTINRDPNANELIAISETEFSPLLKNPKTPTKDKKIILEILAAQLRENYKTTVEKNLKAAIKANDQDLITTHTRNFATILSDFKYSHTKIKNDISETFYNTAEEVNHETVSKFISKFSAPAKKYTAIVKANKIFKEIKEPSAQLSCQITETPETHAKQISTKNYSITTEQTYIVITDIDSKDVHSCYMNAQSRIEQLSTLTVLFHHKECPEWDPRFLIIDQENSEGVLVKKPLNPMLKCIDMKAQKAGKELNKLVENFSLWEDSFSKFMRSAELHSLALKSHSSENQLLNLWISIETLIPSTKEKTKIANIIDSTIPFLSLTYYSRIIKRTTSDFFRWDRNKLKHVTKDIPGKDLSHKIFKIIALDEYSDRYQELLNQTSTFQLLNNRIRNLKKNTNTPKELVKNLENHEKRVSWQIRRIYRTRNLIVHSGQTSPFINILIENIHDYLDIATGQIVKLASDGDKINSLEQAFKLTELNYNQFKKSLKDKEQWTLTEIDTLIDNYHFN